MELLQHQLCVTLTSHSCVFFSCLSFFPFPRPLHWLAQALQTEAPEASDQATLCSASAEVAFALCQEPRQNSASKPCLSAIFASAGALLQSPCSGDAGLSAAECCSKESPELIGPEPETWRAKMPRQHEGLCSMKIFRSAVTPNSPFEKEDARGPPTYARLLPGPSLQEPR